PQRKSRRGLPLGRGSRGSGPCAPRVGGAPTCGGAAPCVRRRRGPVADRRGPESPLSRVARALLARSRPPCRRETCRRLRGGLGVGATAPDGSRLGQPSGGGRRPLYR